MKEVSVQKKKRKKKKTYRDQMEILELKNTSEIKSSLDGLHSRMDMTEEMSLNLNVNQ